jgi:hypothetical protein
VYCRSLQVQQTGISREILDEAALDEPEPTEGMFKKNLLI